VPNSSYPAKHQPTLPESLVIFGFAARGFEDFFAALIALISALVVGSQCDLTESKTTKSFLRKEASKPHNRDSLARKECSEQEQDRRKQDSAARAFRGKVGIDFASGHRQPVVRSLNHSFEIAISRARISLSFIRGAPAAGV